MARRIEPAGYEEHSSMKEAVCYYCRMPARGKDHFPPTTAVEHYPRMQRLLIRCCKDCNRRLGNSIQDTLHERAVVARMLSAEGKTLGRIEQEGFWKKKLGF